MHLRRARAADAARLSHFAAESFRDAFGPANTPADMAEYLRNTFSPSLQAAEIADATAEVLLVEEGAGAAEGVLIGYAHLGLGPAPASVTGRAPIELKRFYVAPQWHGAGVAKSLFAEVLAVAKARGAETLWLGVWERNPRAIAFYAKCGFVAVGAQPFTLGKDVQSDLLLARPVRDAVA